MRLTTVILIASMMQLAAAGKAQRVSMNKTNASLKTIIKELRSQTGFDFVYKERLLEEFKPVTIKVENEELAEVLTEVFKGQPFAFEINSKTVIVKGKEESSFLGKVVDGVKSYLANIDVSGKVVDEQGQPLGGASVVVKSNGKGVSTTADGNFLLKNVEEGVTLIVKFIGFDAKEILAVRDLGVIRLKAATNDLDAVQVQAYGVTNRRLSTSNISTVRSEDIEKQPVSNPLLALQGRVPGLVVTPTSGFAGGTINVRIQGYNSINGSNNPFYVIDGVPFNSNNISPNLNQMASIWGEVESIRTARPPLSGESSGSPFSYINPSDIESIEILKDADATAIYGSKAANGAIIITTKKGKAGPMKIDASIRSGFDKLERSIDFLDYEQYRQLRLEARRNNNESILETDYDLNGFWGFEEINRDYQKSLLDKSVSNHNVQLSASGGTGNADYRINLGYQKINSVVGESFGDEKLSLGLNLNTASLNKRFKMGFSLMGLYGYNRLPKDNPLNTLLYLPPNAPLLYNADGSLNWSLDQYGYATWTNPMANLKNTINVATKNLNSSLSLNYEILTGLKLITTLGFNWMDMKNITKFPITSRQPIEQSISGNRSVDVRESNSFNYIVEPQLSYVRQIGVYKLDFLLGATIQNNNSTGQGYGASNFPSDSQMDNLSIAVNRRIDGYLSRVYRYNAFFSRLNLNRGDEFLINLTVRRDGSSRFGPSNRFSNFAAIGAGWVFTEREWIKQQIPLLSFGKLKTSYGITGSDQIGDYTYLNLYNAFSTNIPYQNASSVANVGLFNAGLKWERNKKLNFGLDLGFFNNKVFFAGNYAINRSDNILMQAELPSIIKVGLVGNSNVYINYPGLIENRSLELSLTSNNMQKGGFKWQTSLNFTNTKNELKSLKDITQLNGLDNLTVGKSILVRKLLRFYGVDPLTGLDTYADRNSNPMNNFYTEEDKTSFVDLLPSYTGGMSNTFSYKGVTLDIFLQFQKQMLQRFLPIGNFGLNRDNMPSFVLDRWRKPGDVTGIARSGMEYNFYSYSDIGYEDASFIRVNNIALSWNLPSKLLNRVKLKQLRLMMQVQNLWTITKYSGLDPQTGPSALPLPRTMMFGMNASF